jgi:hypothetical protein
VSAPPPGAVWLPAEGPVQGRCDTCLARGTLVVEHRMVWGALGEIPADAPAVRDGCPDCGHQGDPLLGSRLVARTAPPSSLAGVMPKLSATECTWLECPGCSFDAPCHFWVWVVCTAPGCTRESRGKLHE